MLCIEIYFKENINTETWLEFITQLLHSYPRGPTHNETTIYSIPTPWDPYTAQPQSGKCTAAYLLVALERLLMNPTYHCIFNHGWGIWNSNTVPIGNSIQPDYQDLHTFHLAWNDHTYLITNSSACNSNSPARHSNTSIKI